MHFTSWLRKICSGEGAICFNQGGMFHGYHDARRPLLHPCNKKGKTPASSGYKSQRIYCTREKEGKEEKKEKEEKETVEKGNRRGKKRKGRAGEAEEPEGGKNRGGTTEESKKTEEKAERRGYKKNQGIQLLENGRKEERLKIPERAIGREEEAN